MMTAITALLGDFVPVVVAVVAVVAAWFGYGAVKKRSGRKEGRREVADQTRRDADEAKKRERAVKPGTKSDASKRMRDRRF